MPTVPEVWFTSAMVQVAAPLAFVVPVQLCNALPDPNVKVTGWPTTSVPGGRLAGRQHTRQGGRLTVRHGRRPGIGDVVGARVTVKVLAPLVGRSWGIWFESPVKVPVME